MWAAPGGGCPLQDGHCSDEPTGRRLASSPGSPSLTKPLGLLPDLVPGRLAVLCVVVAVLKACECGGVGWGVPESPSRVACTRVSVRVCVCGRLSAPPLGPLPSPVFLGLFG